MDSSVGSSEGKGKVDLKCGKGEKFSKCKVVDLIFKSITAYVWISSSQQSLLPQALVRPSHVVLRVQQYLQEQGAFSVLRMFLKSI